jgi:SpoIID/LytB domain protein
MKRTSDSLLTWKKDLMKAPGMFSVSTNKPAYKILPRTYRNSCACKKVPMVNLKALRLRCNETQRNWQHFGYGGQNEYGCFTLHKDEVRSAFADPCSTLFYLQPINKGQPDVWGYPFIGGGLGHGVGLSQTGAQNNLAKLGWSSGKILHFILSCYLT